MGFVRCMTCAFLLHDFLINVNRDVAVSSRRLGPKFIKKSETKKIMKKNKRQRSYRKEWEAKFKWLAFDEEEGLMFCKTCRDTNVTGSCGKKQNVFYKGSDMFKVESIKAHQTSENHRLAESREKARKAAPGTSPAEIMICKLS